MSLIVIVISGMVSKAVGKLHGLADDMDHNKDLALSVNREDYAKYIADLVVCALRLANTFPGRVIDLENEVIKRIETKNGVKLNEPTYTKTKAD